MDPLRFNPAIHVNQEGYVPNYSKKAMVGYYAGSMGEMSVPASAGFKLVDANTGALTPRGQTILAHTPMARFGSPDDLLGAVMWLLSPASAFVTGAVVPIDGGFSAFSGV